MRRSDSAADLTRTVCFSRLLAGFGTLEIFGTEGGELRDSRQHAGADLFAIVEGEDNIGPTFSGQCAASTLRALVLGHSLTRP